MRRVPIFAALLALVTVLAAFAVAVLPAFAGSGGADPPARPTEAGAAALRPTADAAATAWDPDAYLTRAFATEGPHRSAMEDPPFLYDTADDPDVGNGRSPVWTFAYAAAGHNDTLYFVAVRADGGIDYAQELVDPERRCCIAYTTYDRTTGAYPMAAAPPRADFGVDATTAFAAVADERAFRNFTRDHPVHAATSRLMSHGDGASVWNVALHTATHYHATALVDAMNGTVLEVRSWPEIREPLRPPTPPMPPGTEAPEDYHAEYEGRMGLDRHGFGVMVPLEAPEWAETLRVVVDLDGALPGDRFILRLLDEAGGEVQRVPVTDAGNLTLTEFGWGWHYRAEIVPETVLVHDVNVRMVIEIEYGTEPRERSPPEGPFQHEGAVGPFYGEQWFDVPSGERPVEEIVLTLTWNRTVPTQNLELVLVDTYGNPVARATGEDVEAGTSTLTLHAADLGDGCCPGIHVATASPAPVGTPFTLTIEVTYGEPAWMR